MKGISGMVILAIASLIIVVIFMTIGGSAGTEMFEDRAASTYIAAMGLRNAIVQLSLAEKGTAEYAMPKKENYSVEIAGGKLSVQYSGVAIAAYKPKITMSHYTSPLVPTVLTGAEFCIVKKKDPAAACAPVVEAYLKGDAACVIDASVC